MDTGNIVLWVLVYERNLNVKDFALASFMENLYKSKFYYVN